MLFGSPVEHTMLPDILKTTFRAGPRYPRGWESVYLFLAQKPTGVEHDDIGYSSDRGFHDLNGTRYFSIFPHGSVSFRLGSMDMLGVGPEIMVRDDLTSTLPVSFKRFALLYNSIYPSHFQLITGFRIHHY